MHAGARQALLDQKGQTASDSQAQQTEARIRVKEGTSRCSWGRWCGETGRRIQRNGASSEWA